MGLLKEKKRRLLTKVIAIRVLASEKRRFIKSAEAQGITLSKYARKALNEYATRQ